MYTDCPPDRVIEEIKPTLIKSEGNTRIYDAGVNLTGFPSVTTDGFVGTLKIRYSESLDELGELKAKNMHGQYTDYTLCGGRLSVCYEKSGGEICVSVSAPFGSEGIIRVNGDEWSVHGGATMTVRATL